MFQIKVTNLTEISTSRHVPVFVPATGL